jgi:hypothetical protein
MKLNRIISFSALFALFLSISQLSFAQIGKPVALLKGDLSSNGTPATDVSITAYKGSELIKTTKATPEGKFQILLQLGTTYRITFQSTKYYFHEEQLSVPGGDKYQEVPMHVTLKELEVGKPYVFSNLIFEPKSSTISSNVTSDLEAIASAMKHNPKLAVVATVYPDETPSGKKAATQNSLAASRKSALMAFFISKNISASNIDVQISNTIPSSGRFERLVTEEAEAIKPKKKAKKGKAPAPGVTAKKMMLPQNAEITMKLLS